jgi:hypothetical protein
MPEIALSQGFKAAANRRERHFAICKEAQVILMEMLRCAAALRADPRPGSGFRS